MKLLLVVMSDYYKYYEYSQLFVTRLNCGMKARSADNARQGEALRHCDVSCV